MGRVDDMPPFPRPIARLLDQYSRVREAFRLLLWLVAAAAMILFLAFVNPGWAIPVGVAVFFVFASGLNRFDEWWFRHKRPLLIRACGDIVALHWLDNGLIVTIHDFFVENRAKKGGEKLKVWFDELECELDGVPYTLFRQPAEKIRKDQALRRRGDIFDRLPNPKEIKATRYYEQPLSFIIEDYPSDNKKPVVTKPVLTFRHESWVEKLPVPGIWDPKEGAIKCP